MTGKISKVSSTEGIDHSVVQCSSEKRQKSETKCCCKFLLLHLWVSEIFFLITKDS